MIDKAILVAVTFKTITTTIVEEWHLSSPKRQINGWLVVGVIRLRL